MYRYIDIKTYEQDGETYTEETLEIREAENRASTIKVIYKAGSSTLDVTFSDSGYGSNVYCSYQIAAKPAGFPDSEYVYAWKTTRYAKDVERRFTNAKIAYPVPGEYEKAMEYKFFKYIRKSSSQTDPTRTFSWVRTLRGSGIK